MPSYLVMYLTNSRRNKTKIPNNIKTSFTVIKSRQEQRQNKTQQKPGLCYSKAGWALLGAQFLDLTEWTEAANEEETVQKALGKTLSNVSIQRY